MLPAGNKHGSNAACEPPVDVPAKRAIIEVEEYGWRDQPESQTARRGTDSDANRGPKDRSLLDFVRKRQLIIVTLAALGLSCGGVTLIAWQRKTPDLHLAMPKPPAITSVAAQRPAQIPVALVHESKVAVGTSPVGKINSPNEDASAENDASKELLPVSFNIWNRRKQNKVQAIVQNLTNEPMSLTIRAVNQSTRQSSEIYLDLGPGEQKPFSSDVLAMSEQDRVIFHSPQYHDLSTTVP